LKKSHGEIYTPMEYRIWGEMISGGVHRSMTDPPKTAMFNGCGEVSNKKGSNVKEAMTDAVQQLKCAIATQMLVNLLIILIADLNGTVNRTEKS